MTTLYCAICRSRFEPDDDHYRVEMEYRSVDAQREHEDKVLCMDCARDVLSEWGEPA